MYSSALTRLERFGTVFCALRPALPGGGYRPPVPTQPRALWASMMPRTFCFCPGSRRHSCRSASMRLTKTTAS
eukprot:3885167-Alexandrium_andersonii.AAC.1